MIRTRIRREALSGGSGLTLNQLLQRARIEWHGVRLFQPDWSHDSHSIAMTVWSLDERIMFHMMFNAYRETLQFQIPPTAAGNKFAWRRLMDTSLDSPGSVVSLNDADMIEGSSYTVQPYTIVTLVARFAENAATPRKSLVI